MPIRSLLPVALLLLFFSFSIGAQPSRDQADLRNLRSAEEAFRRGFPSEAAHYLNRIPPNSEVRKGAEFLRLGTLLDFHEGNLVQARQKLKELYRGRGIQADSADKYSLFDLYLLEEVVLLRQFRSLGILRSAPPVVTGSAGFQSNLAASNYPLIVCSFRKEEEGIRIGPGLPPNKHLMFANPLDMERIWKLEPNQGDGFQLRVLSRIAGRYEKTADKLDASLSSEDSRLADELRLCREKLEGIYGAARLSAEESSGIREYLYRLYFYSWALDGGPSRTFELADFLFRDERQASRLESLHLFRRVMAQLLSPDLFMADSHMESSEQDRSFHRLATVLRKVQSLYSSVELDADARTTGDLARALEVYIFSSREETDFRILRRALLDVCGENQGNREAMVFQMNLNPSQAPEIQEKIGRRDMEQDSQELFSLMQFRYGELD
ncbi:MAG: hypothetical protein KDK23_01560 [Leptospiraceae bacterium]|nr:hypothetical protein [Leptospiraceae bacterium]